MSDRHISELMTDEDYQALTDARRAGGWQAEREAMRQIVAEHGLPWLDVDPNVNPHGEDGRRPA